MSAAQLGPSLGHAAVEWLQRALRLGPAALSAAGAAPPARLDDGRAASLALVPLDVQRFVLHVSLGDATMPSHCRSRPARSCSTSGAAS